MHKLRVVADENIPAIAASLGEMAAVQMIGGRQLVKRDLKGVDVLLVRSVTQVNETLLAGTDVKFVGTATSGFDHIDRAYLNAAGIGFAYAPGANANSVVEYVLAAIAAVGTKLEQLLEGGRLGIVGYGNIGAAMSRRCDALGIACCVYDPWLDQQDIGNAATLVEVLCCEVVSLHPELTRTAPWPSYHLLGVAELEQLNSDCLLINASRGAVIDNNALETQLNSSPRLQAVLDVWEGEPRINAGLLDRVRLGTAHIAGYSLDGKLQATQMLVRALLPQFGLKPLSDSFAGPELTPLQPPEHLSGAALLRWAIAQRYDIGRDDSLLRESVRGHSDNAAAVRFDRLRRNYRQRRELLDSTVQLSPSDPQDVDLLHALGCKIAPRER